MNKKLNPDLVKLIQSDMHTYGCDEYLNALIQALYNASEDTEDFENSKVTEQYRYYANELVESRYQEPEFDSETTEESVSKSKKILKGIP